MTREQERIVFEVPGLAPASWSGNSRAHWRTKHKDGNQHRMATWIHCHDQVARRVLESDGFAWTPAHLTLTQRATRPRDHDNFLASCKPLIDALGCKASPSLGIIWDDSPEHLTIEVKTEKVAHRKDECVVVEVERR